MPAVTTDLLIGSYPNLPSQTMTVTANAVVDDVDLPAHNYYLYDASSASDLLYRLGANIEGHAELAGGVSCVLQRNRLVRIESDDATAFSLTWPTDGLLRDLLGFVGNLSPAATSHTATRISPLLWSAARPATYRARLGTDGIPVRDTAVGQSATGVVSSNTHNELRENTLTWRYVQNQRIWTEDEAGGEFLAFWGRVLAHSRRFKVYRGTAEDEASTTAITYGTVLPSTGIAYVHIPPIPVKFPFEREFAFVESLHPVVIEVKTRADYT